MSFGYHLMADCAGCNVSTFTKENITAFVNALIPAIDMTAYGEPIIEHFATHNPAAGGYTMLQLIETSDITAHFVDANGEAYFDIFSCKDFDPKVAVDMIQHYFQPKAVKPNFIVRQAPEVTA
jgi:S-adenosylmethionine/arginine decarboxylase-like enzyme